MWSGITYFKRYYGDLISRMQLAVINCKLSLDIEVIYKEITKTGSEEKLKVFVMYTLFKAQGIEIQAFFFGYLTYLA